MDELGHDPLTVAETARLLGRSTEQVRRYLREGVLPGSRIGGQWFITRRDAEELLLRRQEGSQFLRQLATSDPDPLVDAIATGRSGGGNIAAGKVTYLCSLPFEPVQ
jgi:excisionase family DNA binding protein